MGKGKRSKEVKQSLHLAAVPISFLFWKFFDRLLTLLNRRLTWSPAVPYSPSMKQKIQYGNRPTRIGQSIQSKNIPKFGHPESEYTDDYSKFQTNMPICESQWNRTPCFYGEKKETQVVISYESPDLSAREVQTVSQEPI